MSDADEEEEAEEERYENTIVTLNGRRNALRRSDDGKRTSESEKQSERERQSARARDI
jgi:hypothetical protein